ncbi:hypothetical protein F8154_02465 [Alkaliphilus pronyensis]|uniref:Uncharacterized protein n=1 Tax=Alkaliphilus pronyensis TaxID=1482732 RepID=A0A6I0FHZ0_9FIRM|nr:hypothetical protein [Alkaliphilus pronyensis]KAB3537693.1 hypothetical protein F8154_02465 [Alkaliphilus pronyensis]
MDVSKQNGNDMKYPSGEDGGYGSFPCMPPMGDVGMMPPNMMGAMPDMMYGTMPGMMQGAMPGMMHGAMPGMMHGAMPGMMHGAMPGMMHGAMPGIMHGAMPGMMHGAMPGMGCMPCPPPQGIEEYDTLMQEHMEKMYYMHMYLASINKAEAYRNKMMYCDYNSHHEDC